MNDTSFSLLREIGSIHLTGNEEIRFSLDAYRGFRYVSVRRYLKTDGFCGATRDGITLTPEMVHVMMPRLREVPKDIAKIPDGPIGKFAKRAGICVIVSVATFRSARGLDLRQFEEGRGYTKKGIWIPLEKLAEVQALFEKTVAALDEAPPDFNF